MKAQRHHTRFGKAACVALTIAVASVYVLLAAVPALADPGYLDVIGDGVLLVDGDALQAVQGLDIEALNAAIQSAQDVEESDGSFPDMGGDGVVGPEEFPEEQYPDAGGSEVVTATPVPEGGEQEVEIPEQNESQEATPTPETPEDDGDDKPSLPFTGGNMAGFLIAGLGLCLAGVGAIGASRKTRS